MPGRFIEEFKIRMIKGYGAQLWHARNIHNNKLTKEFCCRRKTINCPHCEYWKTSLCLNCISYVACADLDLFENKIKEDDEKRKPLS